MDGLEVKELTLEVNGKHYTMPELLDYWISEREQIRMLKEHEHPKPWTADSVFRRTYFCNVHREDDKVTKWIRRYYTLPTFGKYYELAIVAARIFNHPPTLYKIINYLAPLRGNVLATFLEELQERNEKIWGGAYVITTHGLKMSKIDYCVKVLEEANTVLPIPYNQEEPVSCEEYHKNFMTIDGLGSFLAAQIVADLKNTPEHPLSEAADWYEFSAHGPGSLRGLSWYYQQKITPRMYEKAINGVALYLNWKHCMQDLQNVMCEFDKYCRVLTGSGRSKRRYEGV